MTLLLAIVGSLAFLAALLPRLLSDRPLSMPMIMLGIGVVGGSLPLPIVADAQPEAHLEELVTFTELGLLLALAGAGLKAERRLSLRGWSSTWRLLMITMPLSIAAVGLLGWWAAGLAPVSALLLGAALSPTDPVLAGDVQVPAPGEAKENEIRFTLTTEAGLNDASAMPFVLAAIALASATMSWGHFVAVEVLWRIALGVLAGVLTGVSLGWLIFRVQRSALRLSEYSDGLVILAILALPYAAAEAVHGLGFLATFIAALVIRSRERQHGYHRVLHEFGEQLERLFVVVALLGLGVVMGAGLLEGLRWVEVAIAVATVVVVRPLFGWVALLGAPAGRSATVAMAFFGVRGIGSIYYVAFALAATTFPNESSIWRITAVTVACSVLVHGLLSGPVMRRIEERGAHKRVPSTCRPCTEVAAK